MKGTPDVMQGTLALMVLKTLDVLGLQHGADFRGLSAPAGHIMGWRVFCACLRNNSEAKTHWRHP